MGGKVVSIRKGLTRQQWAKRINDDWANIVKGAVEGFMQLGRDLTAAKAELDHGRWTKMLENDLNFDRGVARVFMRITTWVAQNVGNAHDLPKLLPPDYSTIDKLTRLEEPVFKRLLKDGTICPTLKRNEVAKLLRLQRVTVDEQRVLRLVPRVGKYRTLVIDPAWEYQSLSIAGRAKPSYAMQTLDQLLDLDVTQWVDGQCHLYCWTTNNFLAEACKLVAHWGFQHRTVLTWIKPPPFGLGSYFRNSTEHVLFATVGETTTRPAAAKIPTHFEAPRGEHSEKPEEFYEIVRRASFPPYGEANQRKARSDFTNLFEEIAEAAE
jgi:N6-adenosine-specific RNA methylase IME4